MADISDVMNAVGELVGSTLYPNGTTQPAIVNAPILVQAGWPDSASVQAASAAGKVLVTLFPDPTERNTTRYPERREENPLPAASWTLTQNGQAVTVGGGNSFPYSVQNVAILVNGKVYVVQPGQTDTPSSVCGALYTAISPYVTDVTTNGAVLTFGATDRIEAVRVGVMGTTTKEVGRQERQFSIIIWTGQPSLRDAVAKAIDPVIRDARRVTLADQTIAHLTYVRTSVIDAEEKEGIYRRDLVFKADYPTTMTETWAQIVANEYEIEPSVGDLTTTVGVTTYPSASTTFLQTLNFDIDPTLSQSN